MTLPEGMRPWAAGQSGNPHGAQAPAVRLARKVREMTNDGELILELLFDISFDADAPRRDRLEAAKLLLERGFGRALETQLQVHTQANDTAAIGALAESELTRLADLLATRGPQAPRQPVVPTLDAMGRASGLLPDGLSPVTQPNASVTADPAIPPEGDPAPEPEPVPPAPDDGPDDGHNP
jgi:hypothetical protein